MSRKRVLIIGHTYAAPVNRLKFDLMAKDQRFEFMLMAPKKWQNYLTVADNSQRNEANCYRTQFVNVCFSGRMVLYVIPELGKIINEFKPNLIYCEQEPICFVSLQTALLSRKIPIVYFSFENIDQKDSLHRLFKPIRTLCYLRSIFMVAGSKEVASVIRGHGYKKPIYITPHLGVSEQLFFPQELPALRKSIAENRFLIGYVGRFVEQKDVMTLIKSMKSLCQTVDCHLVLVGAGPKMKGYEEFVQKNGISNRVTFKLPVPHDVVPRLLNCLDVLVLPSKTTPVLKEQFGHILIEAMACGVPVIGSSSGEIPKVIGDAGLVFKEGDAEALSSQLTTIFYNPQLRNTLREKGLSRVKERYTDARIAANMIALYEIALSMERKTPNTLGVDIIQ